MSKKDARADIRATVRALESERKRLLKALEVLDSETTEGSPDTPMPSLEHRRPTGVDVSHWQGGGIDWGVLREEGHQFVGVKLTEGRGYVDQHGIENARNALAEGFFVWGYHFGTWYNMNQGRPEVDALAEATDFTRVLEHAGLLEHPRALPPALDLEFDRRENDERRVEDAPIREWTLRFLEMVQSVAGRVPMIYTSSAFDWRIGRPEFLRRYHLWQADYQHDGDPLEDGNPEDINISKHGWRWSFWQHTNKLHTQALIESNGRTVIDGNVFHGTTEELRAFAHDPDPTAS